MLPTPICSALPAAVAKTRQPRGRVGGAERCAIVCRGGTRSGTVERAAAATAEMISRRVRYVRQQRVGALICIRLLWPVQRVDRRAFVAVHRRSAGTTVQRAANTGRAVQRPHTNDHTHAQAYRVGQKSGATLFYGL